MKKILFACLCGLLLLGGTGCGQKEIILDLDGINKAMETLTTDEFYIHGVPMSIEKLNIMKDLEELYTTDYEEVFGFDGNLVEQANSSYNKDTKEMFAIFKPNEGSKEEITKAMNKYMEKFKGKFEEYQGYLIYVISSDNDLVMKTIKDTKIPVFNAMQDMTKEDFVERVSIPSEDIMEFAMKAPMMITGSQTYIIVKPVAGKEESVQNALEDYMKKLEQQWEHYLPAQYELVKNRKVEKVGDYFVYIISSDNDLVMKTIKSYQK